MSNISEKELLSIANLTGVRLEFANLLKTIPGTTGTENHTIYSLLEQERESIMSDRTDKRTARVFYNLENADESKKSTIPLYYGIADLKKDCGIAYEYFEKAKFGNPVGDFTKKWNIIYAADSYKLITDFIDANFRSNKIAIKYVEDDNEYVKNKI